MSPPVICPYSLNKIADDYSIDSPLSSMDHQFTNIISVPSSLLSLQPDLSLHRLFQFLQHHHHHHPTSSSQIISPPLSLLSLSPDSPTQSPTATPTTPIRTQLVGGGGLDPLENYDDDKAMLYKHSGLNDTFQIYRKKISTSDYRHFRHIYESC